MTKISILHLVDSLAVGGTERVSVNLVNHLPNNRYRLYLATTRHEGPLAVDVAPDVGRLSLSRRHTLDFAGLGKLVVFIRQHNIRLLHAHSSTVFTAVLASLLPPFPKVLWHTHYGGFALEKGVNVPYWLMARRMDGVIAVNHELAKWSQHTLGKQSKHVWYIPNFVSLPVTSSTPGDLPGTAGSRIICVANQRPQKDHPTLLQAMARVVAAVPAAHLILVGSGSDTAYREKILRMIDELGLQHHVTWLGERPDVAAILRGCDIGVLSSVAEGMPLALIEYGMAKLAAVATTVGQCAEVLANGRAGLLVPPSAPEPLAQAILQFLENPDQRATMREHFYQHVQSRYSASTVIDQIYAVYDQILAHPSGTGKTFGFPPSA